jgi:hypothetical protein
MKQLCPSLGKEYPKLDGRTRKASLLRKLEQLDHLPENNQKLVLNMIDTLSTKHAAVSS